MTTTPPEQPEGHDPHATPPPAPYGDQLPPVGPPPPAHGAPPAYGQPGGQGTPPPAPPYGAQQPYGGQPYGGQQQYGAPSYGAAGPMLSDSDQRMWAMLAHLLGIFFTILAPLVIWLVNKGKGQFVEEQSKEALNFQITMSIAMFTLFILTIIVGGGGAAIPWLVLVVFSIIAAIAANRGEAYRYPLTIRLVK